MDSIERAKEIRKTWKGTNKEFVDKVGIPARAAHDKKTKALEKKKTPNLDKYVSEHDFKKIHKKKTGYDLGDEQLIGEKK